jgi:predicted nucleotidyltransferase
LASLSEVKFAYLFGSFARGDFDQKSDVDIAIYFEPHYNTFDMTLHVHHQLEIQLNKEIDIIVLNRAKNFSLMENIFNEGLLLKDSEDDFRVMFELDKEHEIKDYKEFKRLLDVA